MLNIRFLIAFISLLLISCGISRPSKCIKELEFSKVSEKEALGFGLSSLLDYYTETYNRLPRTTEDIIIYIEQMDVNDRLFFNKLYKYLKKNENKLIFISDSLVSIYHKKIDAKKLLIQISPRKPCDNISARVNFFDNRGYYFRLDSLAEKVNRRLTMEYRVHIQETKAIRGIDTTYERVILEYTPNRLKNLCTDETLDIDRCVFLKNAYDFLDSLARANNISRITAPCFIDKVAQD